MIRATRLAILLLPLLVGGAHAQATAWWNAAFTSPGMTNKDQASTWLANKGDNLTKIVEQMYGIPADKQTTIDNVIDAVIKYNNAMAGGAGTFDASKVTPITDRNKIFDGKQYFVPDPNSINAILNGADPAAVVQQSLSSPANQQQAAGTATSTPLHTAGQPLETGAADTPVTTGGGTSGGSTAPNLGSGAPNLGSATGTGTGTGTTGTGTGGDNGRTNLLGVVSATGPLAPDGAPASGDTAAQKARRGNIGLLMAYDWVNSPGRLRQDGPLKTAVNAGVTAGQNN